MNLVVEEVLDEAAQVGGETLDGWVALRAQVLGVQAPMDRYPGRFG